MTTPPPGNAYPPPPHVPGNPASPGMPGGPAPKRSNTGLILGLVGGGIALMLLVAVAIVVWLLPAGSSGSSSAPPTSTRPAQQGSYRAIDAPCDLVDAEALADVGGQEVEEFSEDYFEPDDTGEQTAHTMNCVFTQQDNGPQGPDLTVNAATHLTIADAAEDFREVSGELTETESFGVDETSTMGIDPNSGQRVAVVHAENLMLELSASSRLTEQGEGVDDYLRGLAESVKERLKTA